MGAISGVAKGPLALFLCGVVGECLSAGVLAIPDCLWSCVLEADHVVFPERSA